jgi:predicted alpha/beta superfamily hydrolase
MKRHNPKLCILPIALVSIALLAAVIPDCPAQPVERDMILGRVIELKSKVLNQTRPVFVYKPDNYAETTTRYPVLYLLDGNVHMLHVTGIVNFLSRNGLMPQTIVIGVGNIDRQRDLSPTHVPDRPTSGGADNFLKFFREELIPYVDGHYRTEPYRILVGHSLGGLFAVHALLTQPDLFQAYIAVSPWLVYDNASILKEAEAVLEKRAAMPRFLYMTLGNEGDGALSSIRSFTQMLEQKSPQGLVWRFELMEKEDHGSIPHRSIYDGLEALYSDWRLPPDLTALGMQGIEEHFQALQKKFGYAIPVPEYALNALGYQLLEKKKTEEAVAVLEANVKKFPQSANVYDSLGEASEAAGRIEEAARNYEIAVKKGKKNADPNLPVYQDHLKRATSKLEAVKQE